MEAERRQITMLFADWSASPPSQTGQGKKQPLRLWAALGPSTG